MPKHPKNSGTGVSGVSGGSSQVQATQQKPGKRDYAGASDGAQKYPKPYQPVDASSHGNTSTPPARVSSSGKPMIPVPPMPLYNRSGPQTQSTYPPSTSLNAVAPKGRAAHNTTVFGGSSPMFPLPEGERRGQPLTRKQKPRKRVNRPNRGTRAQNRGNVRRTRRGF